MAEDLGTWPPEQATVLLDVLQKAGIESKAKRTREGVLVTVQDDRADDAHRTLVANMDAIARAARSAAPPRSRNRPRKPAAERGGPRASASSASQRSGTTRFGSLSRPLVVLIIGLLVAIFPPVPALPAMVVTLAVIVYMLGKQTQADGDGGG